MVVDFRQPAAVEAWRPVDDVVMGGVSRSRLERTPDGAAFAGVVSLDSGGGFASVRTAPRDWAVGPARAFVLPVRGDGRRYKLTVRVDDGFDGVQYQAPFGTRAGLSAGEWEAVTLPLEEFAPTFRGRLLPGRPPLDAARIRAFGLLISDRQAGPFRLEIRGIAVPDGA